MACPVKIMVGADAQIHTNCYFSTDRREAERNNAVHRADQASDQSSDKAPIKPLLGTVT